MEAGLADPRTAATERVRKTDERRTAALDELQRRERQEDARAQSQVLMRLAARQAGVENTKSRTLEAYDRRWRQEKDRLAPTLNNTIAPPFDMMGGRPSRNLAKEHSDLDKQWTEGRALVAGRFDQSIARIETQRHETVEAFARANDARDREDADLRAALAQRQQDSFENRVTREEQRGGNWLSREVNERSRDNDDREP
jgi:hypothetical protein